MKVEFSKCPDCGNIFTAPPEKIRCVACTTRRLEHQLLVEEAVDWDRKKSLEEIAVITGLSLDEVKETIKAWPALSNMVETDVVCVKCGEKPAQSGSEFCVMCRLELYKALSDARDDLSTRTEIEQKLTTPGPERAGSVVVDAVEKKRARTAHRRLNPTPKGRYG